MNIEKEINAKYEKIVDPEISKNWKKASKLIGDVERLKSETFLIQKEIEEKENELHS